MRRRLVVPLAVFWMSAAFTSQAFRSDSLVFGPGLVGVWANESF